MTGSCRWSMTRAFWQEQLEATQKATMNAARLDKACYGGSEFAYQGGWVGNPPVAWDNVGGSAYEDWPAGCLAVDTRGLGLVVSRLQPSGEKKERR